MLRTVLAKQRIRALTGLRLFQSTARREGQTLVEFALILPIFLLTLIGTMDFGLGIYYYNSISYLAREGARAGVVLQNDSGAWTMPGNVQGDYTSIGSYAGTDTIVGRIASQTGVLDPNNVTVRIRTPAGTASFLNLPLSVQVDYPFRPMLANWLGILPTINLSAEATMRIE